MTFALMEKLANALMTGPFMGGVISALATALVGFFVIRKFNTYTTRAKAYEAVVAFGTTFRELMEERNRLNEKATVDEDAADRFFKRFFDHQLNQYHFFRAGLIPEELFAEWCMWRWAAAKDKPQASLATCGKGYLKAWDKWRDRVVIRRSSFVRFLNCVHDADDEARVERIVAEYAPRWWR